MRCVLGFAAFVILLETATATANPFNPPNSRFEGWKSFELQVRVQADVREKTLIPASKGICFLSNVGISKPETATFTDFNANVSIVKDVWVLSVTVSSEAQRVSIRAHAMCLCIRRADCN